MYQLQIYKDKKGGYRFRLVAPNNKIMFPSESYVSKSNAIRAAKNLQVAIVKAEIVEDK